MLLLALFATASPLSVTATPVALAPLDVDADGNGVPDGWSVEASVGALVVTRTPTPAGPVARVAYTAGTKAKMCSPRAKVTAGATITVSSAVRGEPSLGDVTAMHLLLDGTSGVLHTARRRIEVGDVGWDPVDIRATAPLGTVAARVCLDVQMVKADKPGALMFQPLVVAEVRATSRTQKLPLQKVILVSVETLRRDHISAYGYPRKTTPSFDALAQAGTSFDRHWAAAPYTHPSLASLITGLLPTRLGFVDNIPSIGPELTTAAQLFARGGYVTAGFSVQYVLSNRYGLNRGFHYYRNHPNDTPAAQLNDELLPFLDEHAEDNLFVWVHWFDPHGPYRPPAGYRQRFENDAVWAADTVSFKPGTQQEGSADIPPYVNDKGKTERRHYVAGYDGDIAYWDAELGKLLRHIQASGWADDTVVVVTADHGESLGDHGRTFCHGSLYEHDLHVPMAMWGPGRVPAGAHVTANTGHIDVLPTLLEYAGLPVPEGLSGSTLRGLTTKRAGDLPGSVAMVGRADNMRWAVRDGDLKLILDRTGELLNVFDLAVDPGETKDLVVSASKDARALWKRTREWLGKGSWKAESSKLQTLDDEDVQKLKELGYLE